ncbi:hypothetical protein BDQ17DRAFT_1243385 [Cyathus striatus]|nr:hypothetical protein BDQ17DRAFT_1243385 [Cyathus striatus]
MRIIHPLLPWYIEIQARTNPSGITIWDIFEGIYNSLHTPINSKEFYTVVLDSNDREVITQAFTYRCEGLVEEMKNGIKRVDFLGPEVWFVGLELGKYGWWTLKTLPAIGEGDL